MGWGFGAVSKRLAALWHHDVGMGARDEKKLAGNGAAVWSLLWECFPTGKSLMLEVEMYRQYFTLSAFGMMLCGCLLAWIAIGCSQSGRTPPPPGLPAQEPDMGVMLLVLNVESWSVLESEVIIHSVRHELSDHTSRVWSRDATRRASSGATRPVMSIGISVSRKNAAEAALRAWYEDPPAGVSGEACGDLTLRAGSSAVLVLPAKGIPKFVAQLVVFQTTTVPD
jgi:hypothetical protein